MLNWYLQSAYKVKEYMVKGEGNFIDRNTQAGQCVREFWQWNVAKDGAKSYRPGEEGQRLGLLVVTVKKAEETRFKDYVNANLLNV